MGINAQVATVITFLRQNRLIGDEILSLGKQDRSFSPEDIRAIGRATGAGWTDAQIEACGRDSSAETFLAMSGFKASRSLDASGFEGADFVHDLNKPIPQSLRDVTTFFYDGGTLEHVFDVATAFKNAFDMLKVGGIALFAPPANNQCGHGFYQFSPEFFFRLLGANGFDSIHVYLVTTRKPIRWLKWVDPAHASRRFEFYNAEPLQLIVIARKVKHIASLVIPQQSDYQDHAWSETEGDREARRKRYKTSLPKEIAYRLVFPITVMLRAMFGIHTGGVLPGMWRRSMYSIVDPKTIFQLAPDSERPAAGKTGDPPRSADRFATETSSAGS